MKDDRVILATVGVALHVNIKNSERPLGWVRNPLREKDATGAGPKRGSLRDEAAQRFEKSAALKKLEHGGRLAARNDEAIEPVKLFRFANQHRDGASIFQSSHMRVVVALNGEHADAKRLLDFSVLAIEQG